MERIYILLFDEVNSLFLTRTTGVFPKILSRVVTKTKVLPLVAVGFHKMQDISTVMLLGLSNVMVCTTGWGF